MTLGFQPYLKKKRERKKKKLKKSSNLAISNLKKIKKANRK